MRFHFTRLVTFLAIQGLAGNAWAQQTPLDQRLHAVGYSACDAIILGRAWGQPTHQMKDWILSKVGNGLRPTLETDLQQARQHQRRIGQLRCTYIEAGFSYSDAQVLAGAWGVDLSEAKSRIGWAGARGLRTELAADLSRAGQDAGPTTQARSDIGAFRASRFTMCDASLLARMWGKTVYENKKYIGQKLLSGWPEIIDDHLRDARDKITRGHLAKCTWSDTGFDYADAQLLSREWGVSTWEAKQTIATKLTWGMGENIETLLLHVKKPH